MSKLTIANTGCKRSLGSTIIAATADRKRIATAGRIPADHSYTDLSCRHLYDFICLVVLL